MAWTNPANFAVNEFPTAAKLNAILDNFDALSAGARVFHNANQSIAAATETALAFNSERYDRDTIHDTVTNNSRLTCKTAGVYLITGSVQWAGSTAGFRQVDIRLNATTKIASDIRPAVIGTEIAQGVSMPYLLAVNDYVELVVFQNTGGALNVNTFSNASPEFAMHFVGG